MSGNAEFQELLWGIAERYADAAIEAKFLGMIIRHYSVCRPAGFLCLLDVPCGSGRHHEILREEGFRVFGVDSNPEFIAKAKRQSSRPAEDNYRVGDMRALDYEEGQFDVVLNFFGSFGYFSDDDNRLVLRELVRVLRPSGLLLLYTWMPSVRQKKPKFLFEELDETHFKLFESRFLDDIWNIRHTIFERRGSSLIEVLHLTVNMRLYSTQEIVTTCKEAGLEFVRAFSGLSLADFTPDAPEMLLIMRKRPTPSE